ncbi:MAG: TolC family protein [Acidobacteriota bacterium]|nr:MAG: TolC family protein [Acidobacteriota bacterium]
MRELSICALIVTIIAGVSGAQQRSGEIRIPEELTLERALEIMRERSPLLLAERQREVAAAGDLEQARKYPNPFFSMETESLARISGPEDARDVFLNIAQPILLGGKRGKLIDVTGALVRATRNDVRAFERGLSFRLKTVHAALVLAHSDLDLANQILAEFDQVIRLSRIRYERGEMAGGELRRVETERLRFLEQQVSSEIELENARAELLGLFGMPGYNGSFRAVPPPRYEDELTDVESLASEALQSRPEVIAQLERRDAARLEVDYQGALGVPDIVPFVGYQRTRDNVLDVRTSSLNFGVGIGLPIFNRNQGRVSRARADLRREEEFERAVRYQVTVEIRQARQAFLSQRKRLTYFEDTYVRTSRQARDIVEAAYRMGGETLINFLDASRVYNETLRAYNRALFDLSVARFGLELALGRELS